MTLKQIAMVLIEKLDFAYPKKPKLFDGLDLKISQGKIIGLLGKNGAGKSTLLRLMAGLLKPSAGKVEMEGIRTFDRPLKSLDQLIFVPEKVSVPEFLKVKEYTGIYSDFYSGFDRQRLNNLLSEFQIGVEERISNLSYGQQKKLQMAIGLSTGAKLLLFDEPTNGLDIPSKSAFKKVVTGSLLEDQTLIISTHQVKDIEHLIDQVIILDEGKVKLQADLEVLEEEFVFSQSGEKPQDVLYSESHLLGARTISRKLDQRNSGGSPDLEMVFQAVNEGKLSGQFLSNHNPVMP
jgi:ABC-2 type transport system ATP-binding protein